MKNVYSTLSKSLTMKKEADDDYIIDTLSETEVIPEEREGYIITNWDTTTKSWTYAQVVVTDELEPPQHAIIQTMLFDANLSDEDALAMRTYYPEYEVGFEYVTDNVFRYSEDLYRVEQDHTSQEDWIPSEEPALYSKIVIDSDGYEEWIQPTGEHNAYKKGDIVHHIEKLWESLVDGNTWEPGTDETLWKEVD